ncbi:hypothetical protein A3A21_03690 [Candidatus Jorgensenbacteria bacterium RIFCSPLOWO2_01_FULL_45_25b]|uniref:PIN domain-containing protein n=1 Tax=Candidatus Jorgensenbacteria bacterium RIFCSPLOWO2_01_FULL_45_25b TaxID=1798471 RepID=A0A1F6BWP7_9BACT|nr:MAG: hypothetical protein A3A21_03690 [Candidatus Jorgensenbacteria bacterium RIFCSPLOWO2_01_FULL_45_25b]HLD33965.1 type II toxin-antitoxin system VapC family toxin [Candidatus Nanoarchaeia archaeon]
MRLVIDTSVIIKGMIAPRRRKQGALLDEQLRLHKTAASILDRVYARNAELIIPTVAIVEIAAVSSRLTGKSEYGKEVALFVRSISQIITERTILGESIDIAAEAGTSGFDSVFIACARVTQSLLVTDDKKMHEAALALGVQSKLLREM